MSQTENHRLSQRSSLTRLSRQVGEIIDQVQGNYADGNRVCPSADLDLATHVLGLRTESGRIKFFPEVLPLIPSAIDVLTLEDQYARLRFTGPCARSSCVHWKNGCSLGWAISRLSTDLVADVESNHVMCPIKDRCRWIAENGEPACAKCIQILHVPIVDE